MTKKKDNEADIEGATCDLMKLLRMNGHKVDPQDYALLMNTLHRYFYSGTKKPAKPNPTFTYDTTAIIGVGSNPETDKALCRAINKTLIGTTTCNVRNKAGKLVPRPGVSRKKRRQLEVATWLAHSWLTIGLRVTVDLTTGSAIEIKVVPVTRSP